MLLGQPASLLGIPFNSQLRKGGKGLLPGKTTTRKIFPPAHPSLQFVPDIVFLCGPIPWILQEREFRRLVHFAQSSRQPRAAATLAFVAVGVAVTLVSAYEVGQVGQLNHHLQQSASSLSLSAVIPSHHHHHYNSQHHHHHCQPSSPSSLQQSASSPSLSAVIPSHHHCKSTIRHVKKLMKIYTDKRSKRTLFIRTKTLPANFGANPLYQATERHLNNRLNFNAKKMKN